MRTGRGGVVVTAIVNILSVIEGIDRVAVRPTTLGAKVVCRTSKSVDGRMKSVTECRPYGIANIGKQSVPGVACCKKTYG